MSTVIYESLDRHTRVVLKNFWYVTEHRHFIGASWSKVYACRALSL